MSGNFSILNIVSDLDSFNLTFKIDNISILFLENTFRLIIVGIVSIFLSVFFISSRFYLKSDELSIQNVGSFRGLLPFFSLLCSLFFLVTFSSSLDQNSLYLPSFLVFLLVIIIFFILNILFILGGFTCSFVKGSGQGASLTYNYTLDLINISSFCVRFFIQLIRIFIILSTLIIFNLTFLEIYYNSVSADLFEGLQSLVHILFEIFHSFFVMSIQISVFIFIVSWLFQFLVFSFNLFSLEL